MNRTRSSKGRRTVTWTRPDINPDAPFEMSCLDLLSAVKEGRIPPSPVWELVGFRLIDFAEGQVIFEFNPAEYHYNRFGMVQGGIECPVLDAGTGYAVHTTLPAGTGYRTLELKVNFLRTISAETGPVRCVGNILHKGSRVAVAEANMMDGKDRLYAHAISTCLLFEVSGREP